jgi:hypothetical protein
MKTMNDLGNIRSVGIKNLSYLILFEVILIYGVYLTSTYKIF